MVRLTTQAMTNKPFAMHKRFEQVKPAPAPLFDMGSLPAYPSRYVSEARCQCDVLLSPDAGVRVGT